MEYMPTLTMLIGLAGAGKSTYAQKLTPYADILSSDDLRMELFGDVNDQEHNTEVFTELNRRCKELLRKGRSVCLDCTNISRKKRMAFLKELKNIRCKKVCVLMAVPYEYCLAQNFARDRQVHEDIIIRQYKNFNIPSVNEGFDEVVLHYPKDEYRNFYGTWNNFYERYKDVSQDNPHHTLSIGEHCRQAGEYVKTHFEEDIELQYVALFHDIAKPDTKSIYDENGDRLDHARYLQHHHVGAYKSLFYNMIDVDKLKVALLIEYHMRPFMAYKYS